jgi:hypothetical protein
MVLPRQLGTQEKTTGRIMMSVIPDLEFRVGWRFKTCFPVGALFFSSRIPSCLNSLKSEISQFRVSSCFEHGKSHAGLTARPMYSTFSGLWCWKFIILILECNANELLKIHTMWFLDFCFRLRLSQLKCTYDKNYRPLHAL